MDIFKKFENVGSFERYLDTDKRNWRDCSSDTGDYYFTQTESYKDASNLLLYGDKDLYDKIMENQEVKKMKSKVSSLAPRRTLYSSKQGFIPHVPNYLCGRPNNMINQRVVFQPQQKIINIAYNCAVNGNVRCDDIVEAACRLVAAMVGVESNGVRLNVYVVDLTEGYEQYVGLAVKIKEASQGFDILKMAYPLAHPSFERRLQFRYMEVTQGVSSSFENGYGRAVSDDNFVCKWLNKHYLKIDKVFCFDSLGNLSVEEIMNKITE